MDRRFTFGAWSAACAAADGGRLTRLAYRGVSLLTAAPARFRPPARDYGRYETRPVFGYDDCFPTVDACAHPDTGQPLPDHGELCWRRWSVGREAETLSCVVESPTSPIRFVRRLRFERATVTWQFEIHNHGLTAFRGLHVMHALMPRSNVLDLTLPPCAEVVAETTAGIPAAASGRLVEGLLNLPPGKAHMLLLRGLRQGRVRLVLRDAGALDIDFPVALFPTLGIWWNPNGYPDEDGLRRDECAFEPIPGACSSLAQACAEGPVLTLPPQASKSWEVTWTLRP